LMIKWPNYNSIAYNISLGVWHSMLLGASFQLQTSNDKPLFS